MGKRIVASSGTRRTWSAAALALLAAGFFAWHALVSGSSQPPVRGEPVTATADAEGDAPVPVEESFALKPAGEYAEVTERPLFVRTRRPVASATVDAGPGRQGAEAVPASTLALTGIVLTGQRRVALLRVDNDPKMMHVAEGQMAGGWKIEAIAANKVVVRRGDAANTLVLDYKKSGPIPVAAAPRQEFDPEGEVGDNDSGMTDAGGNAPEMFEEGQPVGAEEGLAVEDQSID